MLAAFRFVWSATRGCRLRPWRSEYLKWRMETYSGMKAESIGAREFFAFLWKEKAKLVSFLGWTEEMRGFAQASSTMNGPARQRARD